VLHRVAQTIRLQFDRVYRPRIEQMAAAARVLCLTTRPDHRRMWKEYAGEFSGVCFEVRFPANAHGPLAAARVSYRPTRLVKLSHDPLTMARGLFLTKTEEYRWEDEYRCVHLSETGIPDERLRTLHDALRGMILGPAIDPDHRDELLRAVNEFVPVRVWQAELSRDDEIVLREVYLPLRCDDGPEDAGRFGDEADCPLAICRGNLVAALMRRCLLAPRRPRELRKQRARDVSVFLRAPDGPARHDVRSSCAM
jgi:hypothetical protein